MRSDLHVHSTASDGTLTPSELVALALAQGVQVLAIADHDSVGGIPEALEAASGTTLIVVPAVELSAVSGHHDVHVLAYHVDIHSPQLLSQLAELRVGRESRARMMVEALYSAGYEVNIDMVLACSGGGAVGRSHIARALVAAGHAQSVPDAFQRLIGREQPFYVPKSSPSPAEVVTSIRLMGAVPVIAHPGITRSDTLIPEMIEAGLMGIEAYHADHTVRQREFYALMASDSELITTGGTDYHGPQASNPQLGSVDVPDESVRALLRLGDAR